MGSKEIKPLEDGDWFADRPCVCGGRNRCRRFGFDTVQICCDSCGVTEVVTRGLTETSRRIRM